MWLCRWLLQRPKITVDCVQPLAQLDKHPEVVAPAELAPAAPAA